MCMCIAELRGTKWPEDDLEHVKNCPVCKGASRELLYADLTDRVFDCAPGKWSLYLCSNCGVAYLDPRPKADSIFRAYERYYTHTVQNENLSLSFLKKVKRSVKNGYLNSRYGYNLSPSFRLGKQMVLPGYEYPIPIRDLKVDINRDKLFESNQIKGGLCYVHIHIVPCFWAQGYSV